MGATTEELICELDFIFGNGSFKSECLGAYISKVLGTCILAGSFTLKLPQIFNIVSSK